MRRTGAAIRNGQGFPQAYGPGTPHLPVPTQHGYLPAQLTQYPQTSAFAEFRLILTGNPMNDPRPRGPWVSGPPLGFPRPAITGRRLPGGQGTDLFDKSTWQRPYRFTPSL